MMLAISEQACIALPLVLGAYVTLSLLKLPDFALESSYLMGAVGAYLAIDLPLPLMLLAAFVFGSAVGGVVMILNLCGSIPYLLAAIVTNGLCHGLSQYLLGTSLVSIAALEQLHELIVCYVSAIILLLSMAFLLRSQLAYSWAIYGNNPHFFDCHKISRSYVFGSAVLLGHGLAGMGGGLFALSSGFVDLTMNYGIILLCLTVLILGKLAIKHPKPTIILPFGGVLAFFLLQQSLLKVGMNLKYFNAFQAALLIAVLIIGLRRHKLQLDHMGV